MASGDSGISAPYFERCPVPRRSPVWNGPLPSSRRSLSLVPPSTKSVEHLHEDFVNDAPAIGWVNSTPAISLIFSSAITRSTLVFVGPLNQLVDDGYQGGGSPSLLAEPS